MNPLDSVKTPVEAKRDLTKVSFNFSGAHLAYTDGSQGGAASGLNDPILLKSSGEAVDNSLTEEQRELISLIGETPTALTKSVDNLNKQKENPNIMGDNVSQEDFLALVKELAVEKSLRAISSLSLDDEVAEPLAKALSTLSTEDLAVVKSVLDSLNQDLTKAANTEEPTELQKSLSEETGSEGEGEPESFQEQVRKAKAEKEDK